LNRGLKNKQPHPVAETISQAFRVRGFTLDCAFGLCSHCPFTPNFHCNEQRRNSLSCHFT